MESLQSTRRGLQSLRTPASYVLLLAGSIAGLGISAQTSALSDQAAQSPAETMLEPNGTIKLYAGEHFAIRVPLRVSTAVNLGSAELSISLAPDGDRATGEGVTLLARLGAAHVLLGRGDQTLVLHGVVAEIPKHQLGAAHAADYGIRLGSGTTVNIGTPDEQFIDTKALANTLSALHLQLVESPKR